jgi:hypothetical protein
MKTCPDCGSKVYDGICENCQEELHIYENQILQETEEPFTQVGQEFMDKVNEQKEIVKRKKE